MFSWTVLICISSQHGLTESHYAQKLCHVGPGRHIKSSYHYFKHAWLTSSASWNTNPQSDVLEIPRSVEIALMFSSYFFFSFFPISTAEFRVQSVGGNPKCNDGDDDKETIAPPTNGKQSERQMYTQQYALG